MINDINLTEEEVQNLKDAIYMISDAQGKIEDINDAMKKEGRWKGQGEIAAILSNLNELCQDKAGGLGGLLKAL